MVFTQTSSCEFTLSGIVIDEHDQQALSYSTIYIVELEKGYISDINGVFVAPNLCNQTYTLVIGHIGCEPDTMKILITQHTKKTFYLEHHIEELKEFAIIENEIKPLSSVVKKELSPEELSKTRGRTLGESMKELTGVTTFTTGNSISKPVIHGMHSDRILILNNGIRQEGQQWGSEHAPEIDPFIANKLSVVKGAQSVRYGANAIGGVVLVEPADLPDSSGINDEINAIGSSNGQQGVSSAMLEGKSNKLLGIAWRMQGSLKKSGNV
ncbi:MAG: TonB-dependent receptor, partial [Flavobacteriales bacterium CG_4_10_14_0_8_um_filter_32_5]